jgi:hypothetical protein
MSYTVMFVSKSVYFQKSDKLQVFVSKNEYNKRRINDEVYASVPIGTLDWNGRGCWWFLIIKHKIKWKLVYNIFWYNYRLNSIKYCRCHKNWLKISFVSNTTQLKLKMEQEYQDMNCESNTCVIQQQEIIFS